MKEFDVCFSFAGEQREYVEKTYEACRKLGIKVFYDKAVETQIWGKNLIEVFFDIYKEKANYCVMFISKEYATKTWTKFERRTALERALKSENEYILPVRFDDTEIIGLHSSISYIDAKSISPDELAEMIYQKCKNSEILLDLESGFIKEFELYVNSFNQSQNKYFIKKHNSKYEILKNDSFADFIPVANIHIKNKIIEIINFNLDNISFLNQIFSFEEFKSFLMELD